MRYFFQMIYLVWYFIKELFIYLFWWIKYLIRCWKGY